MRDIVTINVSQDLLDMLHKGWSAPVQIRIIDNGEGNPERYEMIARSHESSDCPLDHDYQWIDITALQDHPRSCFVKGPHK